MKKTQRSLMQWKQSNLIVCVLPGGLFVVKRTGNNTSPEWLQCKWCNVFMQSAKQRWVKTYFYDLFTLTRVRQSIRNVICETLWNGDRDILMVFLESGGIVCLCVRVCVCVCAHYLPPGFCCLTRSCSEQHLTAFPPTVATKMILGILERPSVKNIITNDKIFSVWPE